MEITKDILYVGVNDHLVDLFEGQYDVPNGMAYNSYLICDDKVAVMDSVDAHFTDEWITKIAAALGERTPDYLVVQHMEPDHSGSVAAFAQAYPGTTIVASAQAFNMMKAYFGTDYADRRVVVKEGDTLPLGTHTLHFVTAPMVHWPEVIMTYDDADKVLFSADAFGKFGALDVEEPWLPEARRYFIGIVGKYGVQVQAVLKKAAALDIETVCSLHGPVLHKEQLGDVLAAYDAWSAYRPETEGVLVAYSSIYGHTAEAANRLAEALREKGVETVAMDLARCDMAEAVAQAFRFSKLVLATPTYNADVFPFMKEFIHHLTERNYQNRTVALIENGSWAPTAGKLMRGILSKLKNVDILNETLTIKSSLKDDQLTALAEIADALVASMPKPRPIVNEGKQNPAALFKFQYGLFALSAREGDKDNACVINTAIQMANKPERISISVIKANYTCGMIERTGVFNLSLLTKEVPFAFFQHFGFQSGADVDKFADWTDCARSDNGLYYINRYTNAMFSCRVVESYDQGSHRLFIAEITESKLFSNDETVTYDYYRSHIKPAPPKLAPAEKATWVCSVCGYVYEGETLPADFICPLCKHPASDFVKHEAKPAEKRVGFVCTVCGYVYEGADMPDDFVCPLCHHPKSDFKPLA